ncbi:hypothetical protein [Nocardia aurea]|uniref:hypothetical protein n=1 Tax=Nocardia aurea TaxID=2144174 RepID=UPI0033A89CBB
MGGRIDTDPDALIAMARELDNATKTIDASMRRVKSQLNASSWNDPVRKQFEQNLEAVSRLVKQIDTISGESSSLLHRKAQQLREYLGR